MGMNKETLLSGIAPGSEAAAGSEASKTDIAEAIRNFERNRFTVKHFSTGEEAAAYLVREIRDKTVGFGDSATLAEMNLAEKLSEHNLVIDPASHPKRIFGHVVKKAMDT